MAVASDTVETGSPLGSREQSEGARAVQMRRIVKRFGQAQALKGVDFDAAAGEIHALLGENGAGKSTLMHVLSGVTQANEGEILLNGRKVSLRSPRDARRAGIAMVHQHFTLVPAFTVSENLALAASADSGDWFRFSPNALAAPALQRARELGWELPANRRVADLPVGTQQRVEIVKTLATGAQIVVFDEPTAVLAEAEIAELFCVLRALRDEGKTVLLIAHKLSEILAISDRVTVLRLGARVASAATKDTDAAQLAGWMIGLPHALAGAMESRTAPPPPAPSSDTHLPGAETEPAPLHDSAARFGPTILPLIEIENLEVLGDRGEKAIRSLFLQIRPGEIFGIGGVDGNGQTELAEALAGLRAPISGLIRWRGGAFAPPVSPTIGYIPQDRRRSGLAVTMSIEDNLLMDAVREPEFRRGPLLRPTALSRLAANLVEQFDIRIGGIKQPVSSLSGGNQQKIVVARALRTAPEWIVAVNPTRGLDIGASRFVHDQLLRARGRGAAVLLISTDLDEIAALADRAGILSRGELTDYAPERATGLNIGLLLGGLQTSGEAPS